MIYKILAFIFLTKEQRKLGELFKLQGRVINVRLNDYGGWIIEEKRNENKNRKMGD